MKDLMVFIASEDKKITSRIKEALNRFESINFISFNKGEKCINELYKNPQIVVFSSTLPDKTATVMIKNIKKYDPDIAMVAVTPDENTDNISSLINLGAYTYINKDIDSNERIWDVLNKTLSMVRDKADLRRLRFEIGKKYKYSSVLKGKSIWMQELFSVIDKAAKSSIPISLFGEPGTGKKLIAKTIHYNSAFSANPFVEIDLAVIPDNLIEIELLGTERTLITREKEIRTGKFEEAQKGTLYIKGIDKLSLMMQEKFSKILIDKYFFRLGSENPMKFNSRLIISTEESLLESVNKGTFKEDLYYRLIGLPLRVAPLRERNSDVITLARHFLNQFCKENELQKLTFSIDAQDKLANYPYPGNVRELKAVVELATIMCDNSVVKAEHINFFSTNLMANLLLKENTMYNYTRQIIKNFMQKYDNDIVLVSKKLDIGKSTIYRLKKNGEI